MQYDALNRLTNLVDAVGTNVYTYDAASQLLSEDGPWASDTITYTYANRLRTSLTLQQPTGSWTNGYLYDVGDGQYHLRPQRESAQRWTQGLRV